MTFSCDLETQHHILFPIVYVDVHIKWNFLRPTRFKDVIILYDLDLDLEGFFVPLCWYYKTDTLVAVYGKQLQSIYELLHL